MIRRCAAAIGLAVAAGTILLGHQTATFKSNVEAVRVDVLVVSVRSPAKPEFLQDLADVTGGDLLEVESTQDLKAAFLNVLDEFRHRYLLSYSPQGVPKSGWHQLEVKVKRSGVKVKARPGYLGS